MGCGIGRGGIAWGDDCSKKRAFHTECDLRSVMSACEECNYECNKTAVVSVVKWSW